MPSGRTHDSITLWSLPLVATITLGLTQNSHLTLLVSASFLFAGLMFGPDLDIYSQQYKRWGLIRWIWLPYRRSLRHRSMISHGAIIGTIGRVLYLTVWLAGFLTIALILHAIAQHLLGTIPNWQITAQSSIVHSASRAIEHIQQNPIECVAILIGLELGAMSHSLSDWIGSTIKRWKKQRKR